jgi:hypothetical protein
MTVFEERRKRKAQAKAQAEAGGRIMEEYKFQNL